MANGANIDDSPLLVDLIQNAIVTDPQPPTVLRSAELLHAVRSRIGRQRFQPGVDTPSDGCRKIFDLARRPIRYQDRVLSHGAFPP